MHIQPQCVRQDILGSSQDYLMHTEEGVLLVIIEELPCMEWIS